MEQIKASRGDSKSVADETSKNIPSTSENKKGADPAKKAASDNQAPKKKKNIIVVSKPQNSKSYQGSSQKQGGYSSQGGRQGSQEGRRQGQQSGGQERKPANRGAQNSANNRSGYANPSQKLIRPLTKPSQPQMVDERLEQQKRREETARREIEEQQIKEQQARENREAAERAAEENRLEAERKAAATREAAIRQAEEIQKAAQRIAAENRSAQGGDRRGQRGERNGNGERNQSRPDNRQPRGDRPPYRGERGEGQNRPANGGNFNRNGGAQRPQGGGQRPGQGPRPNQGGGFNPEERSQGQGRRQDNRFSRPAQSGRGGFAAEAASAKESQSNRRDEEKRRSNQQDRDKRNRRDLVYEEDNQSKNRSKNSNKAGRFIKPEPVKQEVVEEQIKVITIPETLTIKDLADAMKMQPAVIIKKLFLEGKIVTMNQEISYEDAEAIAIDYEIICEKEVKVDVIEELLKEDEESEEDMENRPPVVCVMGHVDHGKTSLLDAIRKTNVTSREAGGITQHIGAYTVQADGRQITFLDTPGHEAFTAMRMRGANATDIAVLVIAADDGVMPQTVEAINHAKAAGTEIIVAINKIDKPNADVDRVKQEMTKYELIPEDWGGSTVFAPISAKTGEGIPELLEMILLTADVLELKANPNRQARGLVIEAELDKGRGPVATVLVQKGTLHVGDFISAGASHGKVRAMIDDKGRRVKVAGPSTPVEILGLSDVPAAGEVFLSHENDKIAKSYAETFVAQNKEKKLEETKSRMSLDDLFSQIQEGNMKELNLIVKADVQGSVEAVKQSLTKLSNEEVVVKCIHGGVGAINESDVSLAATSNAIIIGFNVRPDVTAKATAEREKVDVRLYSVIYQAIEEIEHAMKGMLDPIFEEKIIGHAEVRQIFRASAIGNIAGSYVLDGEFKRDCKVRITRDGDQIFEGDLASLKRFKDDVKEVRSGFECGLVFDGFDQIQEGDIVEAYIMVEVPR